MIASLIEMVVEFICSLAPEGTMYSFPFAVSATLAVILFGTVCGSVGSLVVGNRMAFFSDALAHCAFAGIAIGLLAGIILQVDTANFEMWIVPFMVCFGIFMGTMIALVREKTQQASDTVIGVFFAGAIGLAAVVLKTGAASSYMSPEAFLFGSLVTLSYADLSHLLILFVIAAATLAVLYNHLVFTSFNTSLARSRGIPVRLCSYMFIILLAMIVNICLQVVGVLLINALLIVPAATAANLCRNMRQLFVCSVALCIFCGLSGQWISWEIQNRFASPQFRPGESGTIVVLAVLLYFLSIFISPWLRNRSQRIPRVEQPSQA